MDSQLWTSLGDTGAAEAAQPIKTPEHGASLCIEPSGDAASIWTISTLVMNSCTEHDGPHRVMPTVAQNACISEALGSAG